MENRLSEKAMNVSKCHVLMRFVGGGMSIISMFIMSGVLVPILIYRYVSVSLRAPSPNWLQILGNTAIFLLFVACAVFVCALIGARLVESLKLLSLEIRLSSDAIAFQKGEKKRRLAWEGVLHVVYTGCIIAIICNLDGEVRVLEIERGLFGTAGFEELKKTINEFKHVIEEPEKVQEKRKEYGMQNIFYARKMRLSSIMR